MIPEKLEKALQASEAATSRLGRAVTHLGYVVGVTCLPERREKRTEVRVCTFSCTCPRFQSVSGNGFAQHNPMR